MDKQGTLCDDQRTHRRHLPVSFSFRGGGESVPQFEGNARPDNGKGKRSDDALMELKIGVAGALGHIFRCQDPHRVEGGRDQVSANHSMGRNSKTHSVEKTTGQNPVGRILAEDLDSAEDVENTIKQK